MIAPLCAKEHLKEALDSLSPQAVKQKAVLQFSSTAKNPALFRQKS